MKAWRSALDVLSFLSFVLFTINKGRYMFIKNSSQRVWHSITINVITVAVCSDIRVGLVIAG